MGSFSLFPRQWIIWPTPCDVQLQRDLQCAQWSYVYLCLTNSLIHLQYPMIEVIYPKPVHIKLSTFYSVSYFIFCFIPFSISCHVTFNSFKSSSFFLVFHSFLRIVPYSPSVPAALRYLQPFGPCSVSSLWRFIPNNTSLHFIFHLFPPMKIHSQSREINAVCFPPSSVSHPLYLQCRNWRGTCLN